MSSVLSLAARVLALTALLSWAALGVVSATSLADAMQPEGCRAPLSAPEPIARRDAEIPSTEALTYRLAIYYAVPTNVPYNDEVRKRILRATRDMQAWYHCATGGRTWEFAFPETVRVYSALQTREYYKNNGDWWGSLPAEMGARGEPVWQPGTVSAIWAHGAGFWAGAAQSCGVDCGAGILGVELFPEFNNVAYSGATCPGGAGVAAWPCTPDGAYVHELGHTLGLPHPADVPATAAAANHSVMQTHWNYPSFAPPSDSPWGLLSIERQTLAANPFMKLGIAVSAGLHTACAMVNLPVNGAAPVAAFTSSTNQAIYQTVFTNLSSGHIQSRWDFGDGRVSTTSSPTHSYGGPGDFTARLRVTAANGMQAEVQQGQTVDVPLAATTGLALGAPHPSPWSVGRARTTLQVSYSLESAEPFALYVRDVRGRQVATLQSGSGVAGMHSAVWNGRDSEGRSSPPGVYFLELRAGSESRRRSIVIVP